MIAKQTFFVPPKFTPSAARRRDILLMFGAIVVAWLPSLLDAHAVQSVAMLYNLANSANPYFVPEHAWTLYIWTPIVVASACLLFLSPGLFLSLALDAAKGVGEWILSALAISLVVVSVATGVLQWVMGTSLRGGLFAGVVVACSFASFGLLLRRVAQDRDVNWPLNNQQAIATVIPMVVVPLMILIALTPKFYWENFNGDGANAFESTRLLLFQSLPFWSPSAGEVSAFPGFTSMLFTFPGSWFIRLFGNVEASVRFPLLLYLPALFGVILALVEQGRTTLLGLAERWMIWLGLVVYVIAMAFSATYNQYMADIALPATQDTLAMICFLGFVLAFVRYDKPWMFFFVGLTFLSLPSGVQLIGFWLLSVMLVWSPKPWRRVVETVLALLVCLTVTGIVSGILSRLNLPFPGNEYGPVTLLRHFAWLQFTDWRRLAFMIVPGGILPAIWLLAWRWQNQLARTLTIVTVTYFAFFYISAYIVLHYFVPVMLLPLVIFWQNELVADPRRKSIVLASAGIAGLVALILSLPTSVKPDTSGRLVGMAIEDRVSMYEVMDPAGFKYSELFYNLFPVDWDPKVPHESYGGSALVWYYYAHQADGFARNPNYVLQSSTDPEPAGMRLVAQGDGASLYVLSDAIWSSHLALRPPTPAGSPLYQIPRGIIFRSVPLGNGPAVIDVVQVVESLGFDINPILGRIGVKR